MDGDNPINKLFGGESRKIVERRRKKEVGLIILQTRFQSSSGEWKKDMVAISGETKVECGRLISN